MNRRFTITAVIAILVGIVVVVYSNRHQNNPIATSAQRALPSGPTKGTIKKSVHVYFADNTGDFLVAEERSITVPDNTTAMGKAIIEQLIKGPKGTLMETLPATTALRDFFLTPNGIAVLDFNEALVNKHPGGVQMELMTLYAIVNSLALNVDQINAVKILINGRESTTLAGHLDTRFPYKANMLLIK